MKNYINSYLIIILSILILSSCSTNYKVLSRSSKTSPNWISAPQKDFFVGKGQVSLKSITENQFSLAQEKALYDIKSKIAGGIVENIYHSSSLYTKEEITNDIIKYVETFKSFTSTSSSKSAYISGITINKCEDYFWEIIKTDKKYILHYYIKYPFSSQQMKDLIYDWKLEEEKRMSILQTIKSKLNNYSTIESIQTDIKKIQSMDGILQGTIKTEAQVLKSQLKSRLGSINISINKHSLGLLSINLKLNGKSIKTDLKPVFETNGAKIKSYNWSSNTLHIKYDYDNCNIYKNNYIKLIFKNDNINLTEEVSIDLSNSPKTKINLKLNSPISITCGEWKRGLFINTCKSYIFDFSMDNFSKGDFKINKIELVIKKETYGRWHVDDNIVFDNINKSFYGNGTFTFRLQLPGHYFSDTKTYKGEGKIYYTEKYSGLQKQLKFRNIKINS